jgi:hypothetical protein
VAERLQSCPLGSAVRCFLIPMRSILRMRLLLSLLVVLPLFACGESPSEIPPTSPPKGLHSVSLSASGSAVVLNDSLLVQATAVGVVETSWTWSSSNQAVATVSSQGWVRGLTTGDATITACGQTQIGLCGTLPIAVH